MSSGRGNIGIFVVEPKDWWALRDALLNPELRTRQTVGRIMEYVMRAPNFELLMPWDISNAPWQRFEIIGVFVIPAEFECFTLRPGISLEVTGNVSNMLNARVERKVTERGQTMLQSYETTEDRRKNERENESDL